MKKPVEPVLNLYEGIAFASSMKTTKQILLDRIIFFDDDERDDCSIFEEFCSDDDLIAEYYDEKTSLERQEEIVQNFLKSPMMFSPTLKELAEVYNKHPDANLLIREDRSRCAVYVTVHKEVQNPDFKTKEEIESIQAANKEKYRLKLEQYEKDIVKWNEWEKKQKIESLKQQLKDLTGE